MKLVFIYGPPAAGKLTVGSELAKITGYTLLDNHRAIDYITEVFPRANPKYDIVRGVLGRKLRLDIFDAAAKTDVNLITTFAPLGEGWQDFMLRAKDVVEHHGGTICFVQLLPTRKVLLERVEDESRQKNKIAFAAEWSKLIKQFPHTLDSLPDVPHLILNNSDTTPTQAAHKIIDYYGL